MKDFGRSRRIRITHLTHDLSKHESGQTHEEPLVSGFFEPPKPTFKTKLHRHCKRFWPIHLVIFVVGFLATTFPMFDYPCHPRRSHTDKSDALESTSFILSSPNTPSTTRKSRSTHYTSRIQRPLAFKSRSIPHSPPIRCTRQISMLSSHRCICQTARFPSFRSRFRAACRALKQNY